MAAIESIFGSYYRRPAVKGPLVRDGENLGWKRLHWGNCPCGGDIPPLAPELR